MLNCWGENPAAVGTLYYYLIRFAGFTIPLYDIICIFYHMLISKYDLNISIFHTSQLRIAESWIQQSTNATARSKKSFIALQNISIDGSFLFKLMESTMVKFKVPRRWMVQEDILFTYV